MHRNDNKNRFITVGRGSTPQNTASTDEKTVFGRSEERKRTSSVRAHRSDNKSRFIAVGRGFGQSGAMFGLDARIALGIFAILAVVASVVAYGRIGQARQSVLLADLQAIEDALQAYQADMGTFFLFTIQAEEGAEGIHDIEALWDKSRVLPGFQKHWNGPYLHRSSRQYQNFGRFTLLYAQGDRKNYCSTDSDCYIWLALGKVPAQTWEDVNRAYDESRDRTEKTGEDISSGRVQADALTDPRMLLLRTIARPQ